MKFHRSLAAILAATIATTVQAETIDVQQALHHAAAFLQESSVGNQSRRLAPRGQGELRHIFTKSTSDGHPAVYVFATGERGFVLAAADDVAISILGYSDDEIFDAADMPPGLDDMLRGYAAEISYASSVSHATAPRRASVLDGELHPTLPVNDYEVQTTDPILPLLGEVRWGQQRPYNLQCPNALTNAEGGNHASTGCMTTALAQVMRYHKHPKQGSGSAFMEARQYFEYIPTVYDFYKHTYDWDAMKDHKSQYTTYYDSKGNLIYDTSAADVYNVSLLMNDVAGAIRTQFGNVSGAVNISIIPALLSYFGYDPGIEQIQRKNLPDIETWNRLIIEELQANRPVYLDGFPDDSQTSSGHAFVCDGYDGKGYFHINWGWNGDSNGYYLMSALNPSVQGVGATGTGYSHKMAMLKGMKPNTGDPVRPVLYSFDHRVDDPGVEIGRDQNGNYYFGGEFAVTERMNIRAKMGILVVMPNGQREVSWDNGGEPVQLLNRNAYYNFKVIMKEEWKKPGVRAYYVYQPCGQEEWLFIRNHLQQPCTYTFSTNQEGHLAVTLDRSEPTIKPDLVEVVDADAPEYRDATLSSIYVGTGTKAYDLYPAFDPSVHLYIARRPANDYDIPGTIWLPDYNKYTVTGTATQGTRATVTGARTLFQPTVGWNRITLTCTANDGVTQEQYHVILIGGGGNNPNGKKEVSVADLPLMIEVLKPEFGYKATNPTDRYFDIYLKPEKIDELRELLLQQ